MIVTYFIGNGFDLGLGLATSYSQFLKEYIDIDSKETFVKNFKDEIKHDLYSWSDVELKLGQITNHYNDSSIFLRCYSDMLINLCEYLKIQQNLIDYNSVTDEIILKMQRHIGVVTTGDGLKFDESEIVRESWRKKYNKGLEINFISFNYTNTLSECLKVYKTDRQKNGLKINDVVHIHGSFSEPNSIILGVDNEEQIIRSDFRTDKRIMDNLIKLNSNRRQKRGIIDKCCKIIDESDVVAVFGMSIGDTDKCWWNYLVNWLLAKDDKLLIIYYRANIVDYYTPFSKLDIEDEVVNKFLSLLNTTSEIRSLINKRIFVTCNIDFMKSFDLKQSF